MPDVVSKIQSQNEGGLVKKNVVIIVAAGRGMRAGAGLPKQYRMIAGKSLLRWTIEAIYRCDSNAAIQVVIHEDDTELFEAATDGLELLVPVFGGASRQASVLNGLKAVEPLDPDFVLIHDAARPFVSAAVYNGVLAKLESGAEAVVPALAIVDTLKRVTDGKIKQAVDRNGLYAIQTPQGFAFQPLKTAHEKAKGLDYTDDGSVMEAAGYSVRTSAGDADNFKVTHTTDFAKAEATIMNKATDVRVGTGYDVHRFEDGDHIWLCGLKVPFAKGLKGHSDADVALHALTDALFASVAAGDIGTHFPPSEEQWRGAPSDIFLKKAASIIRGKGGIIAHVAVCIVCERPKIGPHKDAMRARIADMLAISIERVSVQATTTEKLGFTGREEGIAAEATATIRLPF